MYTLFPQFFDFILLDPPKRCLIISHSQKIIQIYFTISVESSITFATLVTGAGCLELDDLRMEIEDSTQSLEQTQSMIG